MNTCIRRLCGILIRGSQSQGVDLYFTFGCGRMFISLIGEWWYMGNFSNKGLCFGSVPSPED